MKTALIQFDTIWEDKQTNLAYVQNEILSLPDNIDFIVLPEMFTTGFSMKPEMLAEKEQGNTLQTIQKLAVSKKAAITGSWIVKENNNYYNRLFFVFPNGSYKTYNKRHLFTLAGEEKTYTSGNEKLIISYKDWNICLLICYDLRFPVYSRIVKENYDLLVYVASWPDRRIDAWDSLMKARAIENMSYVIGVNRCGTDPEGVWYSGHSQIINFLGDFVIEPFENQHTKTGMLQKESLQNARQKLAFLQDADDFEII